jgi:hypothetical protein
MFPRRSLFSSKSQKSQLCAPFSRVKTAVTDEMMEDDDDIPLSTIATLGGTRPRTRAAKATQLSQTTNSKTSAKKPTPKPLFEQFTVSDEDDDEILSKSQGRMQARLRNRRAEIVTDDNDDDDRQIQDVDDELFGQTIHQNDNEYDLEDAPKPAQSQGRNPHSKSNNPPSKELPNSHRPVLGNSTRDNLQADRQLNELSAGGQLRTGSGNLFHGEKPLPLSSVSSTTHGKEETSRRQRDPNRHKSTNLPGESNFHPTNDRAVETVVGHKKVPLCQPLT